MHHGGCRLRGEVRGAAKEFFIDDASGEALLKLPEEDRPGRAEALCGLV